MHDRSLSTELWNRAGAQLNLIFPKTFTLAQRDLHRDNKARHRGDVVEYVGHCHRRNVRGRSRTGHRYPRHFGMTLAELIIDQPEGKQIELCLEQLIACIAACERSRLSNYGDRSRRPYK